MGDISPVWQGNFISRARVTMDEGLSWIPIFAEGIHGSSRTGCVVCMERVSESICLEVHAVFILQIGCRDQQTESCVSNDLHWVEHFEVNVMRI